MILKRIKTFLKAMAITGIYFGRNLKTVPEGSVVLFPYEPGVLSCGITGILAFKRAPAQRGDFPLHALERKVEDLSKHTWQGLEEKGVWQEAHYLGGEGLLKEIKYLAEQLKGRTVFCDLFSNRW